MVYNQLCTDKTDIHCLLTLEYSAFDLHKSEPSGFDVSLVRLYQHKPNVLTFVAHSLLSRYIVCDCSSSAIRRLSPIFDPSQYAKNIYARGVVSLFLVVFGSTGIRRIVAECNVFLVLWDVVGLDD